MTTDDREKPARRPARLGLTDRELDLLERMNDGARLRRCGSGPVYGGYHEVVDVAGNRLGPRVQTKVLKRAEARGYISYANNAYELTEAGRVALRYIQTEDQRRKS